MKHHFPRHELYSFRRVECLHAWTREESSACPWCLQTVLPLSGQLVLSDQKNHECLLLFSVVFYRTVRRACAVLLPAGLCWVGWKPSFNASLKMIHRNFNKLVKHSLHWFGFSLQPVLSIWPSWQWTDATPLNLQPQTSYLYLAFTTIMVSA